MSALKGEYLCLLNSTEIVVLKRIRNGLQFSHFSKIATLSPFHRTQEFTVTSLVSKRGERTNHLSITGQSKTPREQWETECRYKSYLDESMLIDERETLR